MYCYVRIPAHKYHAEIAFILMMQYTCTKLIIVLIIAALLVLIATISVFTKAIVVIVTRSGSIIPSQWA